MSDIPIRHYTGITETKATKTKAEYKEYIKQEVPQLHGVAYVNNGRYKRRETAKRPRTDNL
jgi:hypothetical protein